MEIVIGIASGVLSLLAIVISVLAYRHGKNRGKVEKAHEMAREYEKTLQSISLFFNVIKGHPQIFDLLNKANRRR